MKLKKYRVRKFRSVDDSDWITLDQVNALLGENESGKTNLLLPLWKLNPSSDGEIDLLADAPRGEYSQFKDTKDEDKPIFITARFKLDSAERDKVAKIAACNPEWVSIVLISRRYDGEYLVRFPKANPINTANLAQVLAPLHTLSSNLGAHTPAKTDVRPRQRMMDSVGTVISDLESAGQDITVNGLQSLIDELESFDMTRVTVKGGLSELRRSCLDELNGILEEISVESPTKNTEVQEAVLEMMPSFIYYSNYGNLDGEIYLPQVIKNQGRSDLSVREAAKARTLKVLFEYVKLDASEILELGRDADRGAVSDDEIEQISYDKKERAVLLSSAATNFTKSFRDWWKQGNYEFKFHADGDHFKIWVSDSIRLDPIELENRSTGLQWFFSFFLVFLNERHDSHFGSILLLDEPGITLHPLAQQDLFAFFEGLSNDNQIIYTTHSPFLMNPDKLDQVKAVYIDEHGISQVSDDLRARANQGTESEQKAIFPVHSALGLTVSQVLFVGCKLLLVEGPSDQYYLNAIKNILIGCQKIHPSQELVFVPAGGVRGIKSTAKILAYDENQYPAVLLDGDPAGEQTKSQLSESLYSGRQELLMLVTEFLSLSGGEVEDFVDSATITKVASKMFRGEQDFEDDFYDDSQPIVPQIKAFCEQEGIALEKGWKVDLAREVKKRMVVPGYADKLDPTVIDRWESFFRHWLEL